MSWDSAAGLRAGDAVGINENGELVRMSDAHGVRRKDAQEVGHLATTHESAPVSADGMIHYRLASVSPVPACNVKVTVGAGDGWDPGAFQKALEFLLESFSAEIKASPEPVCAVRYDAEKNAIHGTMRVLPIALAGHVYMTPESVPAPPSSEAERRAIDALLREDARRTPAFATARKAAVLAAAESIVCRADAEGLSCMSAQDAEFMLSDCAAYEGLRGGMLRPSKQADAYVRQFSHDAAILAGLAAYERARGMR